MTDLREWFKVWALKSINSPDLDELSDHEERVWWRLLMWASLEDDRWHIRVTPKLAGKCASTERKFGDAITHFRKLGMVTDDESGRLFVVNGPKWNEETERVRKPSDDPARVVARVAKHRAAKREGNADVTRYNAESNAPETRFPLEEKEGTSFEVPQEKEKEGEEDFSAAPPRKALRLIPLSPDERLELLGKFPYPGANEQVDLAVSHKAHKNYPDNQFGYVRNWLSRWAIERGFERSNGNGRNKPDEPKGTGVASKFAAYG